MTDSTITRTRSYAENLRSEENSLRPRQELIEGEIERWQPISGNESKLWLRSPRTRVNEVTHEAAHRRESIQHTLSRAELRTFFQTKAIAPQLRWEMRQYARALSRERTHSRILLANSRKLIDASEKVHRLAGLRDGWDAYVGLAPSSTAVSSAFRLLERLFLFCQRHETPFRGPWGTGAMPDGGVQLEWRNGHIAIEIEVSSDGHFNYVLEDREEVVEESDGDAGVSLDHVIEVLVRSTL